MEPTIAWLSQGKVRVKKPGEPPCTIESRFGQSIRDRVVRSQQRHAWKMGGDSEKFLSSMMLWGRAPKDPGAVRIAITSLCRGSAAGQMLYSLETDDLCAVLSLENLGEDERRLWNKNDKRISHLCVAPNGAVACSVRHPFGTANIAVRLNDESGFSEATEGDSLDTAPRWIPGESRRLVFQSAGIGRDRHGNFAGLAPFSIQELDIDSGEMKMLSEDSANDLLTPQITPDGALYYIRRPYTTGREINPLRTLKDIVLFPFRLGYAVFHYLQVFSMIYTGKKLTGVGGPQARQLDTKEMMIWGNRVSADLMAKENDDAPDLVPKTWQLVRQRGNTDPEVVARGVLAYDLAPDGSVVYSNGSAIFLRDSAGRTQRIHAERLIEQVAIIQ
jgi:hypothetical protein